MMPARVVLYHFTTLDNLRGILQTGELLCKNLGPIQVHDAADPQIQQRRSQTLVPCAKGGTLHDYVPFYFAPRLPMLYRITRGGVPGFTGNPEEMVYLLSSLTAVQQAGLPFAFTDSHPLTRPFRFYDDPSDLNRIDWDAMSVRQWSSESDPTLTGRRQAEFLVYQRVPWDLVEQVATKTSRVARQVVALFQAYPNRQRVSVRVVPDWYY